MAWDTEIQSKYDVALRRIAHSRVTVTKPNELLRLNDEVFECNALLQDALNNPSGDKRTWLAEIERLKTELSILIEQDNQIVSDNYEASINYQISFENELVSYLSDESVKWQAVRDVRTDLLTNCDWTQLPDAPLSENKKLEWASYRILLRDIPNTYQTVDSVVWPLKPE